MEGAGAPAFELQLVHIHIFMFSTQDEKSSETMPSQNSLNNGVKPSYAKFRVSLRIIC